MLKITNGFETLTVTAGAFRNIFKAQGFYEVNEEAPKMPPVGLVSSSGSLPESGEENTTGDKSEPIEDISEPSEDLNTEKEGEPIEGELEGIELEPEILSEIPLSEMTPDQLRSYAQQLGVNIKGLKSKRAVIDRIRSVL